MKKLKPYIIIAVAFILIICFLGEEGEVVENMQIPEGAAYDIEKSGSIIDYTVSLLTHSYENQESTITDTITNTITSKGKSIGDTRQNRQLKSDKKILISLNRAQVISEEVAEYGIREILDVWINNQELNDRAVCVVCKGRAEDIFKYNVTGYASSVEFIEGMVRNLKQFNFFPMQYSIMDLYVRVDSEGRNVLLPYVEITDEGIKTTGLAIFKKDKMIGKTDINEAKIINILKDNNVNGMLTLQRNSKQYINCYTNASRKIKCIKGKGKYRFVIDLNLKGKIVSNEFDPAIKSEVKDLKIFEEEMKKHLEKMCNETINNIKCKYKVDVLDLGKFAAAKYGRHTGVDWNEVVCDSPIKVNVKFSIVSEGRGDY